MSVVVRTYTKYHKEFIDPDYAWSLYYALEEGLPWDDGVRTRSGKFTRSAWGILVTKVDDKVAFVIDPEADRDLVGALIGLVTKVLDDLSVDINRLGEIYVNYYKDGTHYAPNHSHQKSDQVIISLGATRTLTIANKSYKMGNGDVAIFGSAMHGVPEEREVKEGRISIALFLDKLRR